MPICETVAILAAEVEKQLREVTSSQAKMLSALKDMPRYKEREGLQEWNSLQSKDLPPCRRAASRGGLAVRGRYGMEMAL